MLPESSWPSRPAGDGESIAAMMMLAAGKGTTIHLKTEGEKEQEALDALVALINNYFDEGE